MVIRDPNHVMTFGRYKGETIEEILWCDPDYAKWLMENTDCDIHQDLWDALRERERQGMDALYNRDVDKD